MCTAARSRAPADTHTGSHGSAPRAANPLHGHPPPPRSLLIRSPSPHRATAVPFHIIMAAACAQQVRKR